MKVKGIELMQMIVDGKIKEGFEIQCTDWKGIYIFQKEEFVSKKIGASIFHRYSLQNFLNTYFEILEDKTEEIEEIGFTPDEWYELNNSTFKITRKFIEEQNNKINELVREINQIKKDLKPLAIGVDYGNDCDKETNCMTD